MRCRLLRLLRRCQARDTGEKEGTSARITKSLPSTKSKTLPQELLSLYRKDDLFHSNAYYHDLPLGCITWTGQCREI